jgi:hypothetical protein
MYSLEYSGTLYMLVSYPCQYGRACWPPIVSQFMQNTPFIGAGRRPAPHPFLTIFLLLKAILFIFISSALYGMRICYVLWEYVNMRESRSTCSGCMGGPGRLPPPSPAPLPEPWGGGGGSRRAGSCLGSWAGKGGSLPCELGGSHSRVYMASLYGRFIRQIYMATLYGGFIWRVKWAHLFKDWKQENIAKQMK